jgi:hypothetical protein
MKYRAWREYRDGFPDVATLWSGDEYPGLTRAVERAVPSEVRKGAVASDLVVSPRASAWCVTSPDRTRILVYSVEGSPVTLDLSKVAGRFALTWVDDTDAAPRPAADAVAGGRVVTLTPPTSRPSAAWLVRRQGGRSGTGSF